MQRKIFTLIFVFLTLNLTIFANYEKNYPHKITQPDGTEIQCYITGDEFYYRIHDKDNYTIIRNSQTEYYVYAIKENDKLISSGHVVGKVNPQAVGLKPGTDISPEKKEQKRQNFLKNTPEKKTLSGYERSNSKSGGWNNGTLNNIVVYIRFSDQNEFTINPTEYENIFNKEEAGFSSMYQYFKDVSHNQTFIRTSFYPTRTGSTILSYQDIHPRSYYLPYSQSNPNGYDENDFWEQAEREHSLLARALNTVKSQIPTSLDLDFNSDGYVDNICFIVRGGTSDWSTLLWPHKWSLFSEDVYINNKLVYTYNFQLEEHLDYSANSVLCHEMFHSLGAPDLYHYSYDDVTPVGRWDLMASNTNPPQSTTSYMKYKYGGWINEIPEIYQSGTYTLNNVWENNNNCYKIASPNSIGENAEFFVIEYRDRNVMWDSNIPGSGLIIYRINPNYDGNSDGPPDEIYVFRPGGHNNQTEGDLFSAHFSNNTGRTTFHDNSNPPCFLTNNGPGGILITNISATGTTMSFDLSVNPIIITNIQNIDFGEVSIIQQSNPKNISVSGVFLSQDMSYEITGQDADFFTVTPDNNWNNRTGGRLSIRFSPEEAKNYEANLVINSPEVETITIPLTGEGIIIQVEAKFSVDKKVIWMNNEIKYTDRSRGTPTTWEWEFEGGEPSVSIETNPVITYSQPGLYSVTLKVTNGLTEDQITETNYIQVCDPEETYICNNSFEFWTNSKPDCWFGTKTNMTTSEVKQYADNAYDGEYYAGLKNVTTTSLKRFSTKAVTVEKDKTYEIKFYAKGKGDITTSLYDERPENAGFSKNNDTITIDSDTWTQYTQFVSAKTSSSKAEFIFLVKATLLSTDLFIDKVSISQTESSVNQENLTSFNVFPNPTNGLLYINTDQKIAIEIYSITGMLITEKEILGNDIINIENFPKGIYMLRAKNEKGIIQTKKLILQ
jgi:M6 family metalloprotease-like protein